MYATALMIQIQLDDGLKNREKVVKNLKEIVRQDPNNWRTNLFAGLKYAQIEMYPSANDLFQANIDNGHNIKLHSRLIRLHSRLIGDDYISEKDMNAFDDLRDEMIRGDIYRNQDIVHFVGKAPDHRIIDKIKGQIFDIKIVLERGFFGKDTIFVLLPKKWIIDDPENFMIEILLGEKSHNASEFTLDEASDSCILVFKDIFDTEILDKQGIFEPVFLEIKHPSGDVRIEGLFKIVAVEKDKDMTDKGLDLAKKYTSIVKTTLFSDEKPTDQKRQVQNTKSVNEDMFFMKKIFLNDTCYLVGEERSLERCVKRWPPKAAQSEESDKL